MATNSTIQNEHKVWENSCKCEYVPPDGGWGFVVTISMIMLFCVTVIPMTGFEIVYGPFLQNVGNVTTGTAIVNNLFNTVLYFTGLLTNWLLWHYSCRKVGLFGAIIYCIGSVSTIFATSMLQLIFTFSVIQGLGFGLMLTSSFTAFNLYFDKKKTVVMNAAQNALGFGPCFVPLVLQYLMGKFGFRGTVAILAAIGLHTIPAMICLHPVKWHLKKHCLPIENGAVSEQDVLVIEKDPLLNQTGTQNYQYTEYLKASRLSLVSMGNFAISVANLDKEGNLDSQTADTWKILVKFFNLGLLKNLTYINITIGLALSMISDSTFVLVYPHILVDAGFSDRELSLVMMTYFASDLISRSIFSFFTPKLTVKNRYLYLAGIATSALFRTAFTMNYSFWWTFTIMTILGLLRCLLQSPFPLVIAEAFPEHFIPAFSIYLVLCGCVSLLFGPLTAIVRTSTNSDIMVVHLLTAALLVCTICWSIELMYVKLKKAQNSQVK